MRYEGVLAGAPGAATAEPSVVEVTAKDRAVLARTPATKGTSATFTGDAKARRLGTDGAELLSLTAPEIRVTSDEKAGEEMTATGGAAFATPTVSGSADELRFARTPEGREAIRLSGNPRVAAKVAPGSGFDPFSAAPADTAASTMTITCEGALDLVTEGEKRTFTTEKRSVVTKEVGGQEVSRVSADSLSADLAGSTIGSLAADGRVEATGKLEGEQGGTWFATGESFRYAEEDGRAVLTGAPAEVRLVEDAGRVNRIAAPTLTFLRRGGTFKGEGGVKATVFLRASEKAPPDPFTLDAGILEVTAAQDPDPKAGPAARISALSAAGQVVLTGRDRTARGESLRYEGDPKRELHLAGNPAIVTQRTVVYGEEVTDEFRSPSFRLRLKERDIAGFDALSGGTFTLHRPLGTGSTAVMGTGAPTRGKTGEKQIERFKGSCNGAMTYDSVLARMTGNAFIEQEIGQRGTFRRVARFQADTIEARRGQAADGSPELLSAEGRGKVVGTGDTWQVLCDTFAVDFRGHKTTMTGKPAKVSRRAGADQFVERAVYDYERDEWSELLRARGR